MLKEMNEPQAFWKRLLALSGFLTLMGAAAAFPRLGGGPRTRIEAQIVFRLRPNLAPGPAEVRWLFRSYAKVTPAPRRFLMTGPILREKPLG